jgi:hypothetical protein
MGECVDCHKAWAMSERERLWWEHCVTFEDAVWPKRCRPCRDKRTEQRESETICSVALERILNQVRGGISREETVARLSSLLGQVKSLEKRMRTASRKPRQERE